MSAKDLFSNHSKLYAEFRPTYPEELYQFIFQYVDVKEIAWDCATGNGQVARRLAEDFNTVQATDISQKQLESAYSAPNIFYSVASAEHTFFKDSTFDLVTVAQALHWLDTSAFYQEVRRVAKPASTIALWGYGNIVINKVLDPHITHFYSAIVGKYWDPARRHIETSYRDIPFPFESIHAPAFSIEVEWTLDHLLGYLESWSATQGYIKANNSNPVKEFSVTLKSSWGSEAKHMVRFPVFMKMGRIQKFKI